MFGILRQNLRERPWLLPLGIVAWLTIAVMAYVEGRLLVAFGVDVPRSFFEVITRISVEDENFANGWSEEGMFARLIVRPFEVALRLVSLGSFALLVGHPGKGLTQAVRGIAKRAFVGFGLLAVVDAAVTVVRYQVIATDSDPNDLQAGLMYFAFDALVIVVLGGVLAERTRRAFSLRTFVFVGLAVLAAFGAVLVFPLGERLYEPGPFDWSPFIELKQVAIEQAVALPVALCAGILLAWFAFEHNWDAAQPPVDGIPPERSPGW